ncbi:MAG: uroporphyrinogen-III C-methyltransferase [Actinomycetota bacterium]
MTGSVALVGAGPGDPGLLTLRGRDLLALADVVVIDRLAAVELLAHCRPGIEVIDAGKVPRSPHGEGMSQDEINACLVDRALAGKFVVRLKGGDPFVFGRGGEEALACLQAGVPFEVVPGISSAIAVPAYAGIPVTHRGIVQDMAIVSGHADPATEGSVVDWPALASGPGTLVLLMGVKEIGKIAATLVEHGRPGDTPVAMIHRGTTPAQRTLIGTLDTIGALAATTGIKAPCVTVIGHVVELHEQLNWFEARPLFGLRVLVPRSRVQAGDLSRALRALGAEPVEVPTIAIEEPASYADLDAALLALDGFEWVVFTSTNAVAAVAARLDGHGLDSRAFGGVRIAAVGTATKRALASLGLRADLVPYSEASTEGLLRDFPEGSGSVLLPRADIAGPELPEGLADKGWTPHDVVAYCTVAAPPGVALHALAGGNFDAVVFTSSSTVHNLVQLMGPPAPSVVVAVIGPKTAAACAELGLRVDVVSSSASVHAVARALADHIAANAAAGNAAIDDASPSEGLST